MRGEKWGPCISSLGRSDLELMPSMMQRDARRKSTKINYLCQCGSRACRPLAERARAGLKDGRPRRLVSRAGQDGHFAYLRHNFLRQLALSILSRGGSRQGRDRPDGHRAS